MSQDSPHAAVIAPEGRAADPAARGGTIGAGLEPEEAVEGAAETAAHTVGPQPDEGLVEPGGVDTRSTR